jgi:prepilin-type N-terminal cleavage/methylation domain-containing protein
MLMVNRPRAAQGFTLVEMMVALVVGLIVVGAVLALVVSIMRSNRQTLQATRLNQELRATLAVIANDLRRARSVTDPLTTAKALGGNPFAQVDSSSAGCIRYAYANGPGGACRVILRATSGTTAVNKIFLGARAPDATTGLCTTSCPATASASGITFTKLGSDQVEITALTFTPATTTATAGTTRRFDVTVTGNLIDQDDELSSITRTMTQSVFVRSVGVGN